MRHRVANGGIAHAGRRAFAGVGAAIDGHCPTVSAADGVASLAGAGLANLALGHALADDQTFKKMVRSMSGSEQAVSRRTFGRALERISQKMEVIVKHKLASLGHISISWDGWTDICGRPFIGYVYHGIGHDWNVECGFLELDFNAEADHTANGYTKSYHSVVEHFVNTESTQIVAVASDNCSTMVLAAEMISKPRIGCLCHIYNLISRELESGYCPISRDTIAAAKAFSKLIKGSTIRRKEFADLVDGFNKDAVMEWEDLDLEYEERDGVPKKRELLVMPKSVLLSAPTRWTTVNFMLERIKKLRKAVCAYVAVNRGDGLEWMRTDDFWNSLDAVIEVIKIFVEQIISLQDRTAVASVILPLLSIAISDLTSIETKGSIIVDEVRYVKIRAEERAAQFYSTNPTVLLCNLLDPRYKLDDSILVGLNITVSEEEKRRMLVQIIETFGLPTAAASSVSSKKKARTETETQNAFTRMSNAIPRAVVDMDEIGRYLREERCTTDFEVYWRLNELIYPNIARAAKMFLGIPATSTEVERLFSKASLELPANRMSMTIEALQQRIRVSVVINRCESDVVEDDA